MSPSVGKTENHYMVTDECIHLYGVGHTPQEAMDDYRSVVISYYENLEEEADELDAPLKHQLEILKQIFIED